MKFSAPILLITATLFTASAHAIPHADCAPQFSTQFAADYVKKFTHQEAAELVSSEGFLEGKALRSALLRIENAKQIYAVYTSRGGGSATDFVLADRDCTIRDMIRVQEE